VSGGNPATTYYASALWQNETGIMRSTGMNNVNARTSLTQKLSDKLSFTVNGSYIQRKTDFVPEGEQTQGVITTLIFTPTTFNPAYDATLGRYPYSPIIGTNALDHGAASLDTAAAGPEIIDDRSLLIRGTLMSPLLSRSSSIVS
jgi:hypothetical protein